MKVNAGSEGISVIVCTYNGASRLPKTLEYLSKQAVPLNIQWEVIIADNASTDGSSIIATDIWESEFKSKTPLITLKEERPGKLFALQKAIKKATYEYIIICDDDNWLSPSYLAKVYNLLVLNADIAALGGFGICTTKQGTELPDWFKSYMYAYAVGAQATTTGYINPRRYLWGAGLATRKSIYLNTYEEYPSFLIGYDPHNILSAEDTEFCLRLSLKNHKLYYDKSLTFQHYLEPERLTRKYLDKLQQGFVNSDKILRKYHTALRVKVKTEGKFYMWIYLLVVSYLKLLLTFKNERKTIARDTIFYLLPLKKMQVDSITMKIKKLSSLYLSFQQSE